jgi:hypothetical protein
MYAELSYFEGYHFQHIVDWQEAQRLSRVKERNSRCIRLNRPLGLQLHARE